MSIVAPFVLKTSKDGDLMMTSMTDPLSSDNNPYRVRFEIDSSFPFLNHPIATSGLAQVQGAMLISATRRAEGGLVKAISVLDGDVLLGDILEYDATAEGVSKLRRIVGLTLPPETQATVAILG